VNEENWATSVLVTAEVYKDLKTQVGEAWAKAKGFTVRRVDRRLLPGDRLEDGDPRIALCGVDKIAPRQWLAETGFECIVDAGLGRKASDFDRYRVTVFDAERRIDKHIEGQDDRIDGNVIPDTEAYRQLEAQIGSCGAAEIAGASVAVPYVSAVAAAVAISRLIAVTMTRSLPSNEVRRLSEATPKVGPSAVPQIRGAAHAGRPMIGRPEHGAP
jgi:hypothetical protein